MAHRGARVPELETEAPAFAGLGLRESGGPSLHPSFLPGPICLLKLLRCPSRKLGSCCPFPLPASLLFLCFYHRDSCRPRPGLASWLCARILLATGLGDSVASRGTERVEMGFLRCLEAVMKSPFPSLWGGMGTGRWGFEADRGGSHSVTSE